MNNVYTQLYAHSVWGNYGPTIRVLMVDGLIWAQTDDTTNFEHDTMLIFIVEALRCVGVKPSRLFRYLHGWSEFVC